MKQAEDNQNQAEEIPWIHADVLFATINGPDLLAQPGQAEQLATELEIEENNWKQYRENWHRQFTIIEPLTQFDMENGKTDFMMQLYDEDQSLEAELSRAAYVITRALEISNSAEPTETVRINVAMNSDRISEGYPDNSTEPVTQNFRTEAGTSFRHSIEWELDEDITEEEDAPSYSLRSIGLIYGMPNEPALVQLFKAIYTVTALFILGPETLEES